MSDYQVRNAEVEIKMKEIGKLIAKALPKGWGFSLMIFNFGKKGDMFYFSNASRQSMIEAMKEFIERNTH